MALKQLIKSVTPPIVLQSRKWLQSEKLYPSWQAALSACNTNYQDQTLCQFRMQRAKLNLDALHVDDFAMNLEYLLIALMRSKQAKPTIVDFGGGLGEQAFVLRKLYPKPFDYIVVENEALVKMATADSFFEYVQFSQVMPSRCDIFFSSGTLQSIESPYALIEQAQAFTQESIVLTRNCFAKKAFYRAQKSRLQDNGPGNQLPSGFALHTQIQYPHQTIVADQLLTVLTNHGWQPTLSKPSQSGIYAHPKLPLYGRDYLLTRDKVI